MKEVKTFEDEEDEGFCALGQITLQLKDLHYLVTPGQLGTGHSDIQLSMSWLVAPGVSGCSTANAFKIQAIWARCDSSSPGSKSSGVLLQDLQV